MQTERKINLDAYLTSDTTALVGRERGEALARRIFSSSDMGKPEDLESKFIKIILIVPSRIVTVNKSFFLGFFENIIQRLGKDDFLIKYSIEGSDYIKSKVEPYVEAALLKASQGDILDV